MRVAETVVLTSSEEEPEEEEGEEEGDGMLSTTANNKRTQQEEVEEEEEEEEEEDEEEHKEEEKGGKKGRKGRGGVSYSSCCFPMSRIKRLIRSEGVIDFRTTPDTLFLINKASEHFLELFAGDAYTCAVRARKKSLSYEYLSSVVYNKKRYEFLSDSVPVKIRAKDALSAVPTGS